MLHRERRRDHGFTLIEVSVVVLIIGILVTVAIVTLLGAQDRAKDAAAKDLATLALKAQKAHYSDREVYTAVPNELQAEEPTLAGPLVEGRVIVKEANATTLEMVSASASGKCFWVREVAGDISYAAVDCDTEPTEDDFGSSW